MLDITEQRQKFHSIYAGYAEMRELMQYEASSKRLQDIKIFLDDPKNWDNLEEMQVMSKEKIKLENLLFNFDTLSDLLEEQKIRFALIDEDDSLDNAGSEPDGTAKLSNLSNQQAKQELLQEIAFELSKLDEAITKLEMIKMFPKEVYKNDAYLDIQAGSGGTEAQDWAAMLLRMYTMWAGKHNFKVETVDLSHGEIAGIKGATLKFSGLYAYGWLRSETGVHRLVRKSPFDSGHRRHTSFAAVFVSPIISDDITIVINDSDLRIDKFRASGAGGQHVNRTDSAVRITHIPTGIVVQSQSDRSQHRNKAEALSRLKSKLYELEQQKKYAEKQMLEDKKTDITWGSQIRSYVLDDSRVKDQRTNVETRNPNSVLDGDIDMFMEAFLKNAEE